MANRQQALMNMIQELAGKGLRESQPLMAQNQQPTPEMIAQQNAINVQEATSSVESQIANTANKMQQVGVNPNQFADNRNDVEKMFNVKPNQNFIFDIFEVLQRPQQAIFNALLNDELKTGKSGAEAAWEGLTGNAETVYGGQILREKFGWGDNLVTDVVGFAADIFADPADLAILPVSGLGKIGTAMTKMDDVADAAGDLLRAGTTPLNKVADKAEYIRKSITAIDDVMVESRKSVGVIGDKTEEALELAAQRAKSRLHVAEVAEQGTEAANPVLTATKRLQKQVSELGRDMQKKYYERLGRNFKIIEEGQKFVSPTELVMRTMWGSAKSAGIIADDVVMAAATKFGGLEHYKSMKNLLTRTFDVQHHLGNVFTKWRDTFGAESLMRKVATASYDYMDNLIRDFAEKSGIKEEDLQRAISVDYVKTRGSQEFRTVSYILQSETVFPYTPEVYKALEQGVIVPDGKVIGDIMPVVQYKHGKFISVRQLKPEMIKVGSSAMDVRVNIPNLLPQETIDAIAAIKALPGFNEFSTELYDTIDDLYSKSAMMMGSDVGAHGDMQGYIRNVLTEKGREMVMYDLLDEAGAPVVNQKNMDFFLGNKNAFATRKYPATSVEANIWQTADTLDEYRVMQVDKLFQESHLKASDRVANELLDELKIPGVAPVQYALLGKVNEKLQEADAVVRAIIEDNVGAETINASRKIGAVPILTVTDDLGNVKSATSLRHVVSAEEYNLLVELKKQNPDLVRATLGKQFFDEIGERKIRTANTPEGATSFAIRPAAEKNAAKGSAGTTNPNAKPSKAYSEELARREEAVTAGQKEVGRLMGVNKKTQMNSLTKEIMSGNLDSTNPELVQAFKQWKEAIAKRDEWKNRPNKSLVYENGKWETITTGTENINYVQPTKTDDVVQDLQQEVTKTADEAKPTQSTSKPTQSTSKPAKTTEKSKKEVPAELQTKLDARDAQIKHIKEKYGIDENTLKSEYAHVDKIGGIEDPALKADVQEYVRLRDEAQKTRAQVTSDYDYKKDNKTPKPKKVKEPKIGKVKLNEADRSILERAARTDTDFEALRVVRRDEANLTYQEIAKKIKQVTGWGAEENKAVNQAIELVRSGGKVEAFGDEINALIKQYDVEDNQATLYSRLSEFTSEQKAELAKYLDENPVGTVGEAANKVADETPIAQPNITKLEQDVQKSAEGATQDTTVKTEEPKIEVNEPEKPIEVTKKRADSTKGETYKDSDPKIREAMDKEGLVWETYRGKPRVTTPAAVEAALTKDKLFNEMREKGGAITGTPSGQLSSPELNKLLNAETLPEPFASNQDFISLRENYRKARENVQKWNADAKKKLEAITGKPKSVAMADKTSGSGMMTIRLDKKPIQEKIASGRAYTEITDLESEIADMQKNLADKYGYEPADFVVTFNKNGKITNKPFGGGYIDEEMMSKAMNDAEREQFEAINEYLDAVTDLDATYYTYGLKYGTDTADKLPKPTAVADTTKLQDEVENLAGAKALADEAKPASKVSKEQLDVVREARAVAEKELPKPHSTTPQKFETMVKNKEITNPATIEKVNTAKNKFAAAEKEVERLGVSLKTVNNRTNLAAYKATVTDPVIKDALDTLQSARSAYYNSMNDAVQDLHKTRLSTRVRQLVAEKTGGSVDEINQIISGADVADGLTPRKYTPLEEQLIEGFNNEIADYDKRIMNLETQILARYPDVKGVGFTELRKLIKTKASGVTTDLMDMEKAYTKLLEERAEVSKNLRAIVGEKPKSTFVKKTTKEVKEMNVKDLNKYISGEMASRREQANLLSETTEIVKQKIEEIVKDTLDFEAADGDIDKYLRMLDRSMIDDPVLANATTNRLRNEIIKEAPMPVESNITFAQHLENIEAKGTPTAKLLVEKYKKALQESIDPTTDLRVLVAQHDELKRMTARLRLQNAVDNHQMQTRNKMKAGKSLSRQKSYVQPRRLKNLEDVQTAGKVQYSKLLDYIDNRVKKLSDRTGLASKDAMVETIELMSKKSVDKELYGKIVDYFKKQNEFTKGDLMKASKAALGDEIKILKRDLRKALRFKNVTMLNEFLSKMPTKGSVDAYDELMSFYDDLQILKDVPVPSTIQDLVKAAQSDARRTLSGEWKFAFGDESREMAQLLQQSTKMNLSLTANPDSKIIKPFADVFQSGKAISREQALILANGDPDFAEDLYKVFLRQSQGTAVDGVRDVAQYVELNAAQKHLLAVISDLTYRKDYLSKLKAHSKKFSYMRKYLKDLTFAEYLKLTDEFMSSPSNAKFADLANESEKLLAQAKVAVKEHLGVPDTRQVKQVASDRAQEILGQLSKAEDSKEVFATISKEYDDVVAEMARRRQEAGITLRDAQTKRRALVDAHEASAEYKSLKANEFSRAQAFSKLGTDLDAVRAARKDVDKYYYEIDRSGKIVRDAEGKPLREVAHSPSYYIQQYEAAEKAGKLGDFFDDFSARFGDEAADSMRAFARQNSDLDAAKKAYDKAKLAFDTDDATKKAMADLKAAETAVDTAQSNLNKEVNSFLLKQSKASDVQVSQEINSWVRRLESATDKEAVLNEIESRYAAKVRMAQSPDEAAAIGKRVRDTIEAYASNKAGLVAAETAGKAEIAKIIEDFAAMKYADPEKVADYVRATPRKTLDAAVIIGKLENTFKEGTLENEQMRLAIRQGRNYSTLQDMAKTKPAQEGGTVIQDTVEAGAKPAAAGAETVQTPQAGQVVGAQTSTPTTGAQVLTPETKTIERTAEEILAKYKVTEVAGEKVLDNMPIKKVSQLEYDQMLEDLRERGISDGQLSKIPLTKVNEFVEEGQRRAYKRLIKNQTDTIERLKLWENRPLFEEHLGKQMADWIVVFSSETRKAQTYKEVFNHMSGVSLGQSLNLDDPDSLVRWIPNRPVENELAKTGVFRKDYVSSGVPAGYVVVKNPKSLLSKMEYANSLVKDKNLDNAIKTIRKQLEAPEAEKLGHLVLEANVASMLTLNMKRGSNELLKITDMATNLFKRNKLLSPAFNIRNITGVSTNMWLSGMSSREILRYFSEADDVFKKGASILVQKAQMDSTAFSTMLLKNPETARTWMAYEKFIRSNFDLPQTVQDVLNKGLTGAGSEIQDLTKTIAVDATKNPGLLDKISLINGMANQNVDAYGRMAVLLKALDPDSGVAYMHKLGVNDPSDAVRLVMFDPKNLSINEMEIVKRVVPFYTFTKMNLAYHMANIPNNAVRYHRMAKALQASWILADVNPNDVDQYKLNQMYVPIPGLTKDGKYYAIKAGIPAADFADMIGNPLGKVTGMINPLIKAPFELASGTQMFTGAPIENFKGERSSSLPFLKKTDEYYLGLTGLDVPARSLYGVAKMATGDIGGGLAQVTGMASQGDVNKTRLSRQYDILEDLKDGVSVLRQQGTILPQITVQASQSANPSLDRANRALEMLLKVRK